MVVLLASANHGLASQASQMMTGRWLLAGR
jgi:hypothetical protein